MIVESFLTVRETAERLGVHENTVRNWAAKGILVSARQPGTRFHRFEPAEVDRVRLSQKPAAQSLRVERRIVGPELADATRLADWARTVDARHVFPRLVRRLLANTPGIQELTARAGEGVSLGGWDVRARVSVATSLLPEGDIVFELGVGGSPATKAQKDYEKRSHAPGDVAPADTTFVFVTPRRWRDAVEWASQRNEERVWKAVKVLDADDLEAWLELTPAVRIWISEQIGLRPLDVRTAERWWDQFRHRTRPALPAGLVTAGREAAAGDLLAQLDGPPATVAIRAGWRDDALAFVACVVADPDLEAAPSRPVLIVDTETVWQRLAIERGATTLIPLFPNPDIEQALQHGKHVVIPFGADEASGRAAITLAPPGRIQAADALRAQNVEFREAERLAAIARRSLPALMRQIAVDPRINRPNWSQPPARDVLAPLVLVGSWRNSEPDQNAIAELLERPWPEIERVLRTAAASEDPPFVESGDVWRVSSHTDAFEVLETAITTGEIHRWAALVLRVFAEPDPSVDLSSHERMLAAIRNETPETVSGVLREGLAEGLALVGSLGNRTLRGTTTCADIVRSVVGQVLDSADSQTDGRMWRSLAHQLPLLAEASPRAFLDHVLDGSRGELPILRSMFTDHGPRSSLDISSPHSNLLWALETLCWSPVYLPEAARALSQLAQIDPDGNLSNRPSGSLINVLAPGLRHTGAPLAQRIGTIEQTVRNFPDIGWKLLMGLWPSVQGFVMRPNAPRFSDWVPDEQRVPPGDSLLLVDRVVELAIGEAGDSPDRWVMIIQRLTWLSPNHRDRVISALEAKRTDFERSTSDRQAIWETLRAEIGHHREFPDSQWAMGSDDLVRLEKVAARLEPTEGVERYAWLFAWRPNVGSLRADDFADREAALAGRRQAAIADTLDAGGLDGIARLAAQAPVPMFVGQSLAIVAQDRFRSEMTAWLSVDSPRRDVARAWTAYRSGTEGPSWSMDMIRRASDDAARLAVALSAQPAVKLWNCLEDEFPDISDAYWTAAPAMMLSSESITVATRSLLRQRRAWMAIETMAASLYQARHDGTVIDPSLVEEVFDFLLSGASEPALNLSSLGHDVGTLLDYLDSKEIDGAKLARIEFALFPLLEYQREPRALYRALGDDPELFVDLVTRVYRGRSDAREVADPADAAAAQQAFMVLRNWRSIPGLRESGEIDSDHLDDWVARARMIASGRDRGDVGDEQIGQLLSGAPEGTDGAWPAEAVREVIERLGSRELENGIQIGKLNARGITSRGIFDGGDQEREVARTFSAWAGIVAGHWPRTSRLLRELAESYERDALREDTRARQEADAG